MKTMKRNYKENGSALISVIIAGSIMSVILLGASQMIERQSQSTAFLEDRLSKVDFQGTLMGKLSDELACTNTINGLRVESEQNLARILEKDGSTAYSNNSSGVNNALSSFNKLSINQIKLINVSTANAPDQSGDMKIRVFPVRQRTGGGPQELAPFDVSIRVRTDSSRALAYCKAYGDGSGLGDCGTVEEGEVRSSTSGPATITELCINAIWAVVSRTVASPPARSRCGPASFYSATFGRCIDRGR